MGVRSTVRLFGHLVRVNMASGMEYRAAFLTQVVGMLINNAAFIVFWLILYEKIGSIGGYSFRDVMLLWALLGVGYGMADVFLGNAGFLSRTIYTAELDLYLLQPRTVLPNFLLSRMTVSGWGDMIYGIVLFLFTQSLTPGHVALFLLFSLLAALLLTSVRVFYHSLTFFLGNMEELAGTAADLVLNFSLYPGSIYDAPASVVLHSLLPAALVSFIPVQIFKSFDPLLLLGLLAADGLVALVAWGTFRLGLRVYESGSRFGARL